MKILIHRSHHSATRADGWSGAPDEARWTREDLIPRIVAATQARGITVVLVDGDGGSSDNPMGNHPEFAADYDAFIAPHYEANIHGPVDARESGSFWGRAAASVTPVSDDRLGTIFWRRYSLLAGKPPDKFGWKGVNVTDYYGFRLTSDKTPGILVEHGVGAPGAPDFQWLRDNVQAIANVWADTFVEFGTLAPSVPDKYVAFSVGRAFTVPATPAQALAEEYAALYRQEAPKAGYRPELAFAQAWKETGKFTFLTAAGTPPASGYDASWNNPAGLGVTGAAGVGNRFTSKLEGVRAHLQHLIWYMGALPHLQTPYCFTLSDQRHFGEHKFLGNDIRKLNGKWAIPGDTYGESISDIADALPLPAPVPVPPVLTPEQEAHRVYELAEARESLVWIARLQRGLDVERGTPYDPTLPPLDPRIKP